jgi:phage repressor protein C with HTH and peptisase S24 domain
MLAVMDTKGSRIAYIRQGLGLSQVAFAELVSEQLRELGKKPGITRGAVANWEQDKGIDLANLEVVADLGAHASLDWLVRGHGEPPEKEELRRLGEQIKARMAPPAGNVILLDERRGAFPESIPLFGTVAAAMLGNGAFLLSQEPIDALPMMPGLTGEEGVYGLIVKGDSMWPMLSDGDPIYVSTVRQPHKNDLVVVQERDSANGQPQGFVKIYERETQTRLFTRQLNPDTELIFEKKRGVERHRVYTRRELAGF